MVACILFLASCEEIEKSDLTLDLTKEATVKAFIYAELDRTSQGLEFAPTGTEVIVSIPNSAFNPSASGNWTTVATVTDGIIELTVPVTNSGVTVSFTPAEFVYDQVQPYGSNSSTIQKLYKSTTPGSLTTVKPGQERTHEITYNSYSTFENFTETVNVKFEGYADIDETNAGNEFIPSSTVIHIYNNDFYTTTTVGAAGQFEVNLPKSENVTLRFETTKTLNTAPVTTKNYRYTTNHFSPSSTSPVRQTISFGSGSLWE